MYRVELKDVPKYINALPQILVPNVPCGVESPTHGYGLDGLENCS